jgi:protein phosphatase
MYEMECFGASDCGKVRADNEDQFLIADLVKTMRIEATSLPGQADGQVAGRSQGKLLLVADGMGGHHAGERASALAIESINAYVLNTMHWFFRLEKEREQDFEEDLKAALAHSNAQVRAEGAANPDERDMGTTLTMAYVIWPRLFVVHAGDSRCYLVRHDQMHQITTDHTFAQQFVDDGVLPADAAEQSQWSHFLWNVVGGGADDLTAVVYKSQLEPADRILLCTDGLTRCLSATEIAEIFSRHAVAEAACRALIDAALDAGAPDNVTAVVAQFHESK